MTILGRFCLWRWIRMGRSIGEEERIVKGNWVGGNKKPSEYSGGFLVELAGIEPACGKRRRSCYFQAHSREMTARSGTGPPFARRVPSPGSNHVRRNDA